MTLHDLAVIVAILLTCGIGWPLGRAIARAGWHRQILRRQQQRRADIWTAAWARRRKQYPVLLVGAIQYAVRARN